MLSPQGRLVYSTCTFSTEEDEGQAAAFAKKPDVELLRMEKLYPHKVAGEGHFAAAFLKKDGGMSSTTPFKPVCTPPTAKAYRAFEKELFSSWKATNLHEVNGTLYALPEGVFDFKGLNVLRVGLKLGEVKNGRFEPDHALAMASNAQGVTNRVELSSTDARTAQYLRGETVEADGKNGWCLVCVDGYPVGWGKRVNGTIKNHYPKALRITARN